MMITEGTYPMLQHSSEAETNMWPSTEKHWNTVTAEALIVWLFFKQYDISYSRMTSDMICMPQIQSLALKSKSEIWHKSKRHGY